MAFVALLGVALAVPVPAPAADSLARLATLYRAGRAEPGLAELSQWNGERVRRETQALLRSPVSEAEAGVELPLAQAAALLHAHRALLDLGAADLRRCRLQLAAATELLQATAPARGCTVCGPFARGLFLLEGLMYQATLDLWSAQAVARAGLERFPDDPELLTVLGSVMETAVSMRGYEPPPDAGRRSQAASREYQIEGEPGAEEARYRLPSGSLAEAESCYARALTRQPGLVAARLRLGRVGALRGRAAQALPDLERIGQQADAPASPRYLAWLFAGAAREQLGDFTGAAVAYSAALEVEPHARAASVGLAHALDRAGERKRAQVAIDATLARRGSGHDPWLSYVQGQPERLQRLLETLREELRR